MRGREKCSKEIIVKKQTGTDSDSKTENAMKFEGGEKEKKITCLRERREGEEGTGERKMKEEKEKEKEKKKF